MARPNIETVQPEYYPPRARWYGGVFTTANTIRRRFWLDRIHLPQGMTFAGTAASFLVPGLGVYIRGPRLWGVGAMLGCVLLALIYFVGFGYPIGNFAFGLLLAAHTVGFFYYCSRVLRQEDLRSRVVFILFALLGIGLLIYLPIRIGMLQRHWLPLRANGHVYVVQRQFPAAAIRRGDWIGYKLGSGSSSWDAGGGHGTINVRSGVGFGPVLAVAGDKVIFSTNGFTVTQIECERCRKARGIEFPANTLTNGILHPLLPHMPQAGEVSVQEKQWFVWPSYSIRGAGNENQISSMMSQLALVSEKDFIGKAYQQWLWRRQMTP